MCCIILICYYKTPTTPLQCVLNKSFHALFKSVLGFKKMGNPIVSSNSEAKEGSCQSMVYRSVAAYRVL